MAGSLARSIFSSHSSWAQNLRGSRASVAPPAQGPGPSPVTVFIALGTVLGQLVHIYLFCHLTFVSSPLAATVLYPQDSTWQAPLWFSADITPGDISANIYEINIAEWVLGGVGLTYLVSFLLPPTL